jgi:hypothetical protein
VSHVASVIPKDEQKQNLPKFSLGEMGRGTALKPSKGRKARACLAASLKGVYHPTKET